MEEQALLETQEYFSVPGLNNQGGVQPDFSIYNVKGDLAAIADAKTGAMIEFNDQARGFIQIAATRTTSKTIIYYTPLGNTPIQPALLDEAQKAGVKIIQIGVK